MMRVQLVNPSNPLVSIVQRQKSRWNRYRVWQPLSLMVLAGVTPAEWDVAILDENVGGGRPSDTPLPDLVGITAFTSQAPRAYEIAAEYRRLGVPVVMGGIHATMCVDEAMERVDSVVTGEADAIWPRVLADAAAGRLARRYEGGLVGMEAVRPARRDLLTSDYAFGAIQTTRGCPMNCTFCSVTAFNGSRYRQRAISEVVQEFVTIPETRVLMVDDNLVGTRPEHIARAKDLFRALAAARHGKEWVCQATINLADDEELLTLAAQAGCAGVFIGFESPTAEGLHEVGKRFNLLKERNLSAAVARIQRHHILVVGSFIIGLDVDTVGIGRRTAEAARQYGVDNLNTLFLTPLPGTRLWEAMLGAGRIAMNHFPEDWKYYTLTFPVATYQGLSRDEAIAEMLACDRRFYSLPRILWRALNSVWRRRQPLISLFGGLSYRKNVKATRTTYREFAAECRSRELAVEARPRLRRYPGLACPDVSVVHRAR
jgi:radical SAM superfamily enzyme YgiQ (UPF0313 family)